MHIDSIVHTSLIKPEILTKACRRNLLVLAIYVYPEIPDSAEEVTIFKLHINYVPYNENLQKACARIVSLQ
jgi:hypothetical protein